MDKIILISPRKPQIRIRQIRSQENPFHPLNPWLKKHLRVFRVSLYLHPFFIFHSYSLLGATHFVPTKKS